MPLFDDDGVIQTLLANRPNKPLRDLVRSRCPEGCSEAGDAEHRRMEATRIAKFFNTCIDALECSVYFGPEGAWFAITKDDRFTVEIRWHRVW